MDDRKVIIVNRAATSTPRIEPIPTAPRPESHESVARAYMSSDLYPARLVWKMFSAIGGGKHGASFNREFAFYVERGNDPGGQMIRHMSFPTPVDFERAIKSLRPHRVEAGGIYLVPPERGPRAADAIAGETAFDIDIDAYDGREPDVPRARSCCSGRAYCRSCWPLANSAAEVISHRIALYGGGSCAVFYSGGRGFHVRVLSGDWMFCSAERTIREAVRMAIVPGGSARDIVVRASRDADMFRTASLIVGIPGHQAPTGGGFLGWYADRHPDIFVSSLASAVIAVAEENADMPEIGLETEMRDAVSGLSARINAAAKFVDVVARELASQRESDSSIGIANLSAYQSWTRSIAPVTELVEFCKKSIAAHPDPREPGIGWTRSAAAVVMEAAVSCMWPRIDAGMSDQPGHLLRAPMGVHGSTGRLGVYVPPEEIASFYPDDRSPVARMKQGGGVEFVPAELATEAFGNFERWIGATFIERKPDSPKRP
jgi:hypothetical protein